MRISVASDHAGFDFKNHILKYLAENEIVGIDLGTDDSNSVDYPDYASKAAKLISSGEVDRGILICGTGIGMSIVANKFAGVRAALCHNEMTAEASRRHNDSNILVLGGRVLRDEAVISILKVWLRTPFDGGRHQDRIDKIHAIENAHGIAAAISIESDE